MLLIGTEIVYILNEIVFFMQFNNLDQSSLGLFHSLDVDIIMMNIKLILVKFTFIIINMLFN